MAAAFASPAATLQVGRPCDASKLLRSSAIAFRSCRAPRCNSGSGTSTSSTSMLRSVYSPIGSASRPVSTSSASASGATAPTAAPPPPFASAVVASAQLIAMVLKLVISAVNKTRDAVTAMFPQLAGVKPEEVRQQLQQLKLVSSGIKLLAFVAPFAKATASESLTAVYTRTFERAAFGFAKMYLFCLFMRVLLSWFPSIDWNAQPWTFLRLITEPYLQIYRGILPPLFGQLDFTPLFGFLILQDVVEVMAPTYTMGMHAGDTSTRWTTSDVMCYFDGW